MNEFTDMLQRNGVLLGFASPEIACAYIGSLLASLLCVIYGLITWNRGRKRKTTRVRSSKRGRRVKKGRRPWRR